MAAMTLRHSDIAWASFVAAEWIYSISCPRGELLSEASERYIDRHPVIVRSVIIATALHLAKMLPRRLDIYHGFGFLDSLMDRWLGLRKRLIGY
jgi:hypothetical protein